MYIRHTLHKIVTAVHFIDTRGHSLLAVKMNNTTASEVEGTNEDAFDLFVYECESEVRKATRLKFTLHKINTLLLASPPLSVRSCTWLSLSFVLLYISHIDYTYMYINCILFTWSWCKNTFRAILHKKHCVKRSERENSRISKIKGTMPIKLAACIYLINLY